MANGTNNKNELTAMLASLSCLAVLNEGFDHSLDSTSDLKDITRRLDLVLNKALSAQEDNDDHIRNLYDEMELGRYGAPWDDEMSATDNLFHALASWYNLTVERERIMLQVFAACLMNRDDKAIELVHHALNKFTLTEAEREDIKRVQADIESGAPLFMIGEDPML